MTENMKFSREPTVDALCYMYRIAIHWPLGHMDRIQVVRLLLVMYP